MSYTKAQFTAALQNMAAVPANDAEFTAIFNSAIDYAEQRIYREVDFLSTVERVTDLSLTASARELDISSRNFVVVQQVSVRTRLSPSDTQSSQRNPLSPVSRDLLDAVYGSPVPTGLPQWFAMLDHDTIMVGPYPDEAYPVEIVGTVRPAPLYSMADNESTFLSKNLPDLMMAATMIFVSGFQKNFGSQADNPQIAMSWESQYKALLGSAVMEEARKKFQASGWTSLSEPEAATTSR